MTANFINGRIEKRIIFTFGFDVGLGVKIKQGKNLLDSQI